MASPIRLFVDAPLYEGVTVAATAGQAHYLASVMRRAMGDPVCLFNGRDGEWSGAIAALKRDRAVFKVATMRHAQAAEPDLWLVFALLKRDATDLVVQKATELGVSALVPVLTARTNADRINAGRLTAIAIEAAEQCERLTVPELHPPTRLDALLAAWPAGRRLVVAAERADAPSVRPIGEAGAPAALLVGPEGGFTPGELDVLRSHPFVQPASFGPRILRAETAAIAGLALLQAQLPV